VPTYEYACAECGERLEAVQKFSDDPLTVCPACGGRLRKLFSPVGIVFKGSGFYRTDSRSGAAVNGSKANGSSSDSSSASEKSSGEKSSGADAKPSGSDSGSSGSTGKSEKKTDKTGTGTSSGTGTKVA
jgi:putative FmdB family regulatory protein